MLRLLSGPPEFNCWISFAPVFSCMYCWVLIFVLSPFCILILCNRRWFMDHKCKPNIYASWSTSELRVRLVPWSKFKASSIFLTDRSKAVFLLCIFLFCYLSLPIAVMSVSCGLVVACWGLCVGGLTSWLSCMWCFLVVFVTFAFGVLGQVYLIVLIPDLCLLPYCYQNVSQHRFRYQINKN